MHKGLALVGGDGADLAVRRMDQGALDDGWGSLFVEEANQGFADLELGDRRGGVEGGGGAEGVGGGADGLLVAGGEGAEGVLDPVAELAEDGVGDVDGVLGDEEDADAFGADEADDLLDAGAEDGRLGSRIRGEEEVGLVEEEDELGFGEVAGLGQVLEELGEQPEEEGGIELGGLHETVGGEEVDDAAAVAVGLEEVFDVEGGLAEELVTALAGEGDKAALDGSNGGSGDVAVLLLEGGGVLADVPQHGLEVFEVEQEEAVVVGDLEDEGEDAGLDVVEVEDAGEDERAHFGDGGADGVALLAEDVPEGDRGGLELKAGELEALEAGVEFWVGRAGLGDAGEVALDVGGEDGDTDRGEGLGHDLEGDGFAGAGSSGDEPVAVGHLGQEGEEFGRLGLSLSDNEWIGHGISGWVGWASIDTHFIALGESLSPGVYMAAGCLSLQIPAEAGRQSIPRLGNVCTEVCDATQVLAGVNASYAISACCQGIDWM